MQTIHRDEHLKAISRDHHHGLLLCWKIRTRTIKKVEVKRMKAYVDWFFETHLLPHFELEEKYLFPILGSTDELVKKEIADHKKLKRLFRTQTTLTKTLSQIEEI